ncbi:MAG: ABC transporter permease family protein, partial [Planctomycetota bacterium]
MKGLISWLIVAVIGFLLMAFSYFNYQYDSGTNPWSDAFMYIGEGQPYSEAEELEYITRPLRLLPMPRRAENFAPIARNFGPNVEKAYRFSFQEKVILYSDTASDFTDQMLEWGCLPSAGADEVVAGFSVSSKDNISVKDRPFKVVGQFKREVGLFGDSYLIRGDDTARELFDADDEAVQQAHILRLPKKQLSDSQISEKLTKLFPKSEFVIYYPKIRTELGAFLIYIAGISLLFLGGCLVFFKLYCLLADKLGNKWLRQPLAEIRKYKHLFLALHL